MGFVIVFWFACLYGLAFTEVLKRVLDSRRGWWQ